jgi:hypothetical protein
LSFLIIRAETDAVINLNQNDEKWDSWIDFYIYEIVFRGMSVVNDNRIHSVRKIKILGCKTPLLLIREGVERIRSSNDSAGNKIKAELTKIT